ncbi:MAG: GerW family sporulation protein [Lachnospiraceae bacterium]|nr:GerW family sporulation protein [Lachnospiraceae bacterium]
MADNNDFKNTVETLFEGMEGFLQSKTVVGEAVHVGDTVVLPLVDVTFGVGAGANAGDRKYGNAGGGIGGRMSPSAMLVISNGTTKLVSVKSQDSVSKILDMVPDMVNKFTNKGDETPAETKEE